MPSSPFGQQLRFWRERRALSQLALASRAETTPRYVSFLETGRARPGREVVLRLASSLDLAIRDQNALLVAAGLPPAFAERALDDALMRPVRAAVEAILKRHDPYPGAALNVLGKILLANRGFHAFSPGSAEQTPEEGLESFLAPGPGRELIENWAEVAWTHCDRLQAEAARNHDPRLRALADRAREHLQDVPRPAPPSGDEPVMSVRFRVGDQVIRTVATVLRFETAYEVTSSELRVELIFPMDDAGDRFFRELYAATS
ncbi:MAG: helix-turn-helix domain-containing protein [Myxococcota bacterium]